MRKFVLTAGLAALMGVPAVSAGDLQDNSAESRAYLNYSFGGHRELARELHMGLLLTQHSRATVEGDAKLPAVMQLDFASTGVNTLRLNGMSLSSRSLFMQQAEGEAAAAAEDVGFFEGIFNSVGDFFGGLFGGDEEAAPAEEGAAEEGMFANYTAGDWALLGVGVLGVGYIASEAFGGDDSDPAGGGAGGNPEEGEEECILSNPLPLGPECPILFTGKSTSVTAGNGTYQEWLDQGTGQMGDLIAQ